VTTFSEHRRQIVHIAMGGFAFLLRVLTWWQAALAATAALLFNIFVLPRIGGRALYRPSDVARGFPLGILLYPLAVLLLVLVFPHRLDIAAAAWGILAAGDGAATLVGRHVRSPRLPWNSEKSVAGTLAFLVAGSIAGVVLAWWTAPAIAHRPPLIFLVGAPIVAAVLAALVETVAIRLDDNLSVTAVAALTLWTLSLVRADVVAHAAPLLAERMPAALIVNAVVSALGWRAGAVSVSGAIVGAGIGVVVYLGAGLSGWLLLFASFLAAAIASRLGWQRKSILGIAEERGGRRGPGNAIANCVVAAGCAAIASVSPYHDAALLAFAAALAAGSSDTVASEIGKAWGRRTFSVTSFATVRPGTSGAMSLEGTAAGVAASILLAVIAFAGGLIDRSVIWCVVVGAFAGSLVESLLSSKLEAPGILNNDALNFINTLVAAVVAVLLSQTGLIS
jgi:uncharacterized protein (TIGR00297 family)